MVKLTHLGQRFMLTTNPFATPILYENVFRYLVVGVGSPDASPSKYSLDLPVGASSSSCSGSPECSLNGHAFDIRDNVLYCDVTIVRTWVNTLPLPVGITEFGFSPNPAGTPLSAVGHPGSPDPVLRTVLPGESIAFKLTLSLAIGPLQLSPASFYLGGGYAYTIQYGIFADGASRYADLIRMAAGMVTLKMDFGSSVSGYQPTSVQLAVESTATLDQISYSHPYAGYFGSPNNGNLVLEPSKAIVVYTSRTLVSIPNVYRYDAGIYFTIASGSPNLHLVYLPALNVSVG